MKHSKYRNTGIIFELLSKQIVSDILSKKDSGAKSILFKYFKKGTQLNKELEYYQALAEDNKEKDTFMLTKKVDLIVDFRNNQIDLNQLKKEKYNILGEIKKKFNESFFTSKIDNFKRLATIFKLFEYYGQDSKEYLSNYENLITSYKTSNTGRLAEYQEFKDLPLDVKEYTFDILLKKFNEKYKNALPKQKAFLGKFVTESIDSSSWKNYFFKEISNIKKSLEKAKLTDPIRQIKLNESIQLLNNMITLKHPKEEHYSSLLKFYELEDLVNDLTN